jgi:hypothetical protein
VDTTALRRRPAPAGNGGGSPAGPRVTVVTPAWGGTDSEAALVTRLVAGALARSCDVHVVHLTPSAAAAGDGRARRSVRDGAFSVTHVDAAPAASLRQALLLGALLRAGPAGALPEVAGEHLLALETSPSDGLVDAVADSRPDVVVVAGTHRIDPEALPALRPRPRLVVMPLLGDDPRLGLASYSAGLSTADAVGAVTAAERRRLNNVLSAGAGARGEPPVHDLGVALNVNRATTSHRLVGTGNLGEYLVIIRAFPKGGVPAASWVGHDYLRACLGPVSVAEVNGDQFVVSDGATVAAVPVSASRVNLWRLMAHALATIDLRRTALFGREALESMLLGTPVLVGASHPAREYVSAAGAGGVFADPGEMMDLAASLLDRRRRVEMSARAAEWSSREHGDHRAFERRMTSFVLPTP